jgi:hypothetical protein
MVDEKLSCGGQFDAERFRLAKATKGMKQGLLTWRAMEGEYV